MDGWKQQVQIDLYMFFGAGLHKHIRDATLSSSNPPTTAEALLKAARFVETSKHAEVLEVSRKRQSHQEEDEEEICQHMEALRLQPRPPRPYGGWQNQRGLVCW